MQVFQRIGQAMYQQNQQAASRPRRPRTAGAGASADAASEDDVVEGEIVEEGGAS